jgi:hypothetical protein
MEISVPVWFFVGSFSVALTSIMWCFTILGEVNGRRPDKNEISIWELDGRLHEVLRLHAELFPDSPH